MATALPIIWILIIGFGVVMYVILDGFTLGTGMLMPFMSSYQRDIAASVILPNWDGNQTWLVLGAAALYGAFPRAFSAFLPLLYIPLFLMIIALLLRGVVFEFRLKAKPEKKHLWDRVFAASSVVVTLIQGLVLGNFIEGFKVSSHPFLISKGSFFSVFSIFTAISLVFGYALLGACRLILKTEGTLQKKMYRLAWGSLILIAIALVAVSLWTPFVDPHALNRWFSGYNWLYLSFLPLITGLCFLALLYTLYHQKENYPYYLVIILFLCPYLGFIISVYPYIIPYKVTLWQAAAPTDALLFILVGTVIMLPVLLFYTWYSYKIFKGKVKEVLEY
jgi:cytochrome d ubiquinol oxidase subunit II